MNTETFLRAILPRKGTYILAAFTHGKQSGPKHFTYQSIGDLATAVGYYDARGIEVYHACATFSDPTLPPNDGLRSSENAAFLHAAYVDLDVDPKNQAKYACQRDAAKALVFTCKQLAIPDPTFVVSSGRGLHCYWVFERDISAQEAKPVFAALNTAFTQHGLKHDNKVTGDVARILRPVGSHWRKEGEKLVRVLFEGEETTFDAIKTGVAHYITPERVSLVDSEWGVGEIDYPPSSAQQVIKHCPALAEVAEAKGDVEYHLWFGMVGVVKHCIEGEDLVHQWSEGHPDYSHTETQAKIDSWSKGPSSCAYVESSGGACAACAHKGKVKSPIVLGAPEPEDAPPPEQPVVKTLEDISVWARTMPEDIPFWPKRYRWDGRFLSVAQTNDGVVEYVPFCDKLLYPYMRFLQEDGTWAVSVCMRGRGKAGRWREFRMPTQTIGDQSLKAYLSSFEVFLIGKEKESITHMRAFLQDMIRQLEYQGLETKTITGFGWDEDGFVIGDSLLTGKHELPVLLSDRLPHDVRGSFGVTGTAEGWARIINEVYNRPGAEPYQFLICAAFGAPLVQLSASGLWHGIPIALTGESGLGKSTTCMAACSMYGHPSKLMIAANDQGSTLNALIQRVAVMRNLPLVLDELHGMKSADLPSLLYALSNGKPKNTLNMDRSFRNDGSMWNTLTFVTGNRNITQMLGAFNQNQAEATQLRVFEIPLDKGFNTRVFGDINAKELIEGALIEGNHGTAGRRYIEFLVKHKNEITERVQKVRQKLIPATSDETKERFYFDTIAMAIVGGTIAKKLGLIDFDMNAVKRWALEHIKTLRDLRFRSLPTLDDQIQSFMSSLVGRTVITNHYPQRFGMKRTAPEHVDERGLRNPIARMAREQNILIVTAAGFREWCTENAVDTTQMLDRMDAKGYLKPHSAFGISQHGKLYPFKGTNMAIASTQTRAIVFDLNAMAEDVSTKASVTLLSSQSPEQSPEAAGAGG